MDIRTALQQQAPSLALQRAAGDLVAELDALIASLENELISKQHIINNLEEQLKGTKNET